MSGGVTDNLSEEGSGAVCRRPASGPVSQKIQQLLAAVGSQPTEDTTQIEAEEYNWHEPHYFSAEQLLELENLTGKIAAAVADRFTSFCSSRFDATIVSTTQHFADEFLDQPAEDQQKDYYLAFGADREPPCGLVGMPEQTAAVWAKQLLGDSESDEDSTRDLSQLEKSLLLDLGSALVEVFSGPRTTCDFHPATSIVRGQWPLELQGTEELCKISFDVKKADSEDSSAAYLLIACSKLEPLLGKNTQAAGELSADDISKAVLGHLQHMPVTVTAQLASTMVSFEEIMNLQADDILLLDKRVNEPVELIADGRTICRGWPAKSAGKYAVTITATAFQGTA
jgi:flagellar motor switch protein FliM